MLPNILYQYTLIYETLPLCPATPMSGTAKITNTVVPAQLSFLAIYNPSLGNNDEAIYDQVVYYHSSKATKARRRTITAAESSEESKEERNERLRQIGLAQGMVDFAKLVPCSNLDD